MVIDELLKGLHGHLISGAGLRLGSSRGISLLSRGRLLALLARGELSNLVSNIGSLGQLGNNLGLLVDVGLLDGLHDTLGHVDLSLAGSSSSLLLAATEGLDGSSALFEVPVVALARDDALADVALAEESNIGSGELSNGVLDGTVSEGLDGGLELVVTVQVGGPAGGVELLAELGLERVNDDSNLEAGVGGEDGVAVDLLELESPVVDEHNLLVEVLDLDVRELLLELGKGVLGEVGGHEEERVRDKEVGVSFLDKDLDRLLAEVSTDLVEVTSLVDHLGEEGFECAAHFLVVDLN